MRVLGAAPLLGLALAACGGPLSTLDPAGPASTSIALVWWWMLGGAALVMAAVIGLAALAFRRPKVEGEPTDPMHDDDPRSSVAANRSSARLSTRGVGVMLLAGGVALPVVTIVALLTYGLPAGQSMRTAPEAPAYVVDVIAHQWRWEVRYPDRDGAVLSSENVIHIPAGQKVALRIGSADVIHSFWVPRLGGKIDAIPGRTNVLYLQADAPGEYAGVCAEFCGIGHAEMPMTVVAHDASDLAAVRAGLPARAETGAPK